MPSAQKREASLLEGSEEDRGASSLPPQRGNGRTRLSLQVWGLLPPRRYRLSERGGAARARQGTETLRRSQGESRQQRGPGARPAVAPRGQGGGRVARLPLPSAPATPPATLAGQARLPLASPIGCRCCPTASSLGFDWLRRSYSPAGLKIIWKRNTYFTCEAVHFRIK